MAQRTTSGSGKNQNDLNTAKAFVLIALILNAIAVLVGLGLFVFIRGLALPVFQVYPHVLGYGILALATGLIWLILNYALVYKPLTIGRVQAAKNPALILGVLQLFFAGLIPGICLLIAWILIKDM